VERCSATQRRVASIATRWWSCLASLASSWGHRNHPRTDWVLLGIGTLIWLGTTAYDLDDAHRAVERWRARSISLAAEQSWRR